MLFVSGFYGSFVHAGVGFVLIMALALTATISRRITGPIYGLIEHLDAAIGPLTRPRVR